MGFLRYSKSSATGPTGPFSGGKSQLNLNFPAQYEYPFANIMLQGGPWSYLSGPNANGRLLLSELDENGMPTTLSNGNIIAATNAPTSLGRPGNYVVRTTGTGTISVQGAGSPLTTGSFTGVLAGGVLTVSSLTGSIAKGQALVGTGVTAGSCIGAQLSGSTYQINNYLTGAASTQSLASVSMTTSNGSLTVSGSGRYVVYPGDRGFLDQVACYITSIGSPAITQYAMMHVDDELAWVLDPYAFNPQYKNALKTAKFGALRDLNWVFTNVSNVSTWSTRKPKTYFNWGFDETRASLNAGTATHATGSTINISSATYSSGTGLATIVVASAHGKTGTFPVSIQTTSAGFPTYNGTFHATVVNSTTFTYPLNGTPATPSALGTANFGVYDYSVTFNDPVYGNGAPVHAQTYHIYFDLTGTCDYNSAISFSGTKTCNWSGHTFTGGEMVGFAKDNNFGNGNMPNEVGQGQIYYVLTPNLVAGTSFEFSLTPGGAAVTFTPPGGVQTGCRLFTINQNGTGRVPILGVDAMPLAPDLGNLGTSPSPVSQFGQAAIATVVYDATLKAFIVKGGCLNGDGGIANGVPPEIFLKLCSEVGAYSQHTIPVMALDPQTDYVPNLYTQAKLVSWNKPAFECANEIWNSGFVTTPFARTKSFVNWGTGGNFDEASWMGKVNSTTGQILKSMAGTVGNNYEMLYGYQTVSFNSGGQILANDSRLNSANYVAQSAAAQTLVVSSLGLNITFTKTAAYKYGTRALLANYITPAGYSTFDPTTFIANFAICRASIAAGVMTVTSMGIHGNGAGTLKVGQTVTDFYGQIPGGVTITSLVSGTTGGTGQYNLSNSSFSAIPCDVMATNSTATAQVNSFLNNLSTAASPFNNAQVLAYFTNCMNYVQTTVPNNDSGVRLGVRCYEGGYGVDYPNANLGALYEAAKYSPYLGIALCNGGLMADGSTVNGNYKDLVALGVVFPSAFTMGGDNNSWSIADPDLYATPLPSYTAITAFNA